jgi:hypothetical protein
MDNLPNHIPVYPEIMMDQYIPHPGNLFLFYRGVLHFQRFAYRFNRLPDNFKIPQNGVLSFYIVDKAFIIEAVAE